MQPLSENSVNIPAFLSKLWKMVNDPSTNHLICWSPGGNSFIIQNQAQFWYDLLPLYYKHNNMSSFVRQLNMYGFHKISTVENGTMDSDKDEIQFYHPFFQKNQPEMLKEIKRKVTNPKSLASEGFVQSSIKTDVTKVLADVKQLRNHQQTVDSQLSAIKQENAVLWRELAMLRQKHMKQQQIVNKLIQFLVTIVQPSNRMSGLGVKRRYPLMINGTPYKKSKTKKSRPPPAGPTIHELDCEGLPEDLLGLETPHQNHEKFMSNTHNFDFKPKKATQKRIGRKVQSPSPNEPVQKTPPHDIFDDVNIDNVESVSSEIFLDSQEEAYKVKPEYISIDELLEDEPVVETSGENEVIDTLQQAVTEEIEEPADNTNNVFLNPSTQDTLLCNLMSGNYNTDSIRPQEKDKSTDKGSKKKSTSPEPASETPSTTTGNQTTNDENNMSLVTRDNNGSGFRRLTIEELDEHLQTTQSELDQLKEVLNGCGTFDANALLGVQFPCKLFSESPSYSLSYGKNKDVPEGELLDPGNELTAYDPGTLDFNEFFDEAGDLQDPAPQGEWVTSDVKDVQSIKKKDDLFPSE